MKKLMLTLLIGMVFILTACGGRVETTTVCEIEQNDTMGAIGGRFVVTLEATGDRITYARLRMSYDVAELLEQASLTQGREVELDELLADLERGMAMLSVEGVEVEVELVGDYIYTVQVYDFDVLSDQDFRRFFGNVDFLSLSISIEEYEDDLGGVCTTTER